jgi:hypothetical protein
MHEKYRLDLSGQLETCVSSHFATECGEFGLFVSASTSKTADVTSTDATLWGKSLHARKSKDLVWFER